MMKIYQSHVRFSFAKKKSSTIPRAGDDGDGGAAEEETFAACDSELNSSPRPR